MALGTPVAAAAAYSAQAGTTVTPAYPSGILATDVVLLFVGQKPSTANGGTVTTPTGWTLRDSLTAAGGYGTTLGVDTGNTNLFVYSWDTPVAGQTGTRSVTIGTNNITWAFMVRIPKGSEAARFGSADGQRTTAPTTGVSFSVSLTNGATATNFQAGDVAIWAMCVPTDNTTPAGFSAQTITATGATFGTVSELNEPDSPTGNDIGGYSAWASVTSGSSTAAPSVAVTPSGTQTNVNNIRGPIVLLRVRELPAINAEVGSFTYTGQTITDTVARNINAEAGSFAYTGQDAELIKSAAPKEIDAEDGTFSYTGQDATLVVGRAVNAESGAFSYNGQATTLQVSRKVNAEAGSFSYTGQNATLATARSVNAEAGSFSYTGQDATLARTRSFNAEAGSFSYTGQDATLTQSTAFNAESGAFNYTGQDATLNRTFSLNAEAGSFSYVGQEATLQLQNVFILEANAGSFSYTGQDATLAKGSAVNAEAGSYAYTGQNAEFAVGLALNAEAGVFGITGADANLIEDEVISAEAGTFGIAGQDATLARSFSFNAEAGSFDYIGQNTTLILGISLNAEAGSFAYLGQDAEFSRTRGLVADTGVFSNAPEDLYVEPGYVDPDYATGLEATLSRSLALQAGAGAFTLTGQPATLVQGQLYPSPADVRLGVVYGPDGIYTGTLVVSSSKPIYIFDD